ncbi:MAG TPA: hypothetical protein VJ869_08685 [Sphaerochaeta sp.]|nr:hypothetical protein [Sphaerochaeta sp.]
MQEKDTSAAEKTEEKTKSSTRLQLSKAHVAMFSVSATVLVFILAFSCYGCSYQPITPPTQEEAKATFENLYNSTWVLDTAMGVPTLPEIQGLAVEGFVIERKNEENESASAEMLLKGRPSILVELAYREDYGFTIKTGGQEFAVKLLYSESKDGKSETLTMIGNESNTHCYYLKR